jgi:hypothetical protein
MSDSFDATPPARTLGFGIAPEPARAPAPNAGAEECAEEQAGASQHGAGAEECAEEQAGASQHGAGAGSGSGAGAGSGSGAGAGSGSGAGAGVGSGSGAGVGSGSGAGSGAGSGSSAPAFGSDACAALLSAVNSARPLERLQELIDADASILRTRFDGLGDTILHVLAMRKGQSTRIMIDAILLAGVLPIDVPNAKGQTPLHSCVVAFNAFMVPFLVSRGADALALDAKGRNCLQLMSKEVRGLLGVAERDDDCSDDAEELRAAARATAMGVRRCVSDDDWSYLFVPAAEDAECCAIAFGAMELANEFEGVSRARVFALYNLGGLDPEEFNETIAAAAADEAAAAREAAAVAEAIAWLAEESEC